MKIGSKYIEKRTRRIVTVVGSYFENASGKKVINFSHYGDRTQIGALYRDDFKNRFKKKETAKH